MEIIDTIRLCKMTPAQMHTFFKEFTYDPATFANRTELSPYRYNAQGVDAYYQKHKEQRKLHFAIMLGDKVIGDIYLKQVDCDKHSCELGIHLVNDSVKNKGYGTRGIELLLLYAFNELKMEKVFADCLITNRRSQHVLTKVGFVEIMCDEAYVYYECNRKP